MHIAQVFSGEIPPRGYGGIERVIYWLIRQFIAQGHRITLIADAASQVVKEFPEINFFSFDNIDSIPDSYLSEIDILHFHNDVVSKWINKYPYVVTEHGNNKRKLHFQRNTVFLSKSHAENHNATYFLPNGIPIEDYPYSVDKHDNMLYMAKLNWRSKNAKTAINLAFDTDTPIYLTGGLLRESRKVWGSWIFRYPVYRHLIKQYGVVDGPEKLELLKSAMCLFYLVNWHEPFALAPHEALACGTPVLASKNGALKEYIKSGENGYIVGNYAEAIDAIQSLKLMSANERQEMANRCRASAYTIEDSVQQHLTMYDRILSQGYLYTEDEAKRIRFINPSYVTIKKR